MSQHLIYIHLEGYLRQWLVNRLGNPVQFNRGSHENALLKINITDSVPPHEQTPVGNDMVGIVVPRIDGKPWSRYHYLGRRGAAQLVEAIETLFRIDLWQGCARHIGCNNIQSSIESWCRNHGISIEYRSAVHKKFYRMRNSYSKRGVILGKKYVKSPKVK